MQGCWVAGVTVYSTRIQNGWIIVYKAAQWLKYASLLSGWSKFTMIGCCVWEYSILGCLVAGVLYARRGWSKGCYVAMWLE
jgi:hypothetical protein